MLQLAAVVFREPSADSLEPLLIFLWAAGGSLALEIVTLYNEIKAERATGLPRYYQNPAFWMVRLLVTVIAGMLAIAERATNPLLAINIGAAAPAILQSLVNPPRTSAGIGKSGLSSR